MSALLETRGLTVSYGGVNANHEVDLTISAGSVVGLIGPNGAGKTTFIDAITGFVQPSSGRVHFAGTDITRHAAHRRFRSGLARTWQSLELFEDLTVADNLLIPASETAWYAFLLDIVHPGRPSEAEARVEWALDQLSIGELRDAFPKDLSHGKRRLVGVARALAAKPKLLLLDEPAAGLDKQESQALGRAARGLLDQDITVFLIDHDMGLVLNVCDYLYVLDFGRLIASGTPAEVRANPDVVAAYLGASAGETQAREGDVLSTLQREVAEVREELRAAIPAEKGGASDGEPGGG